MAGKAGAHAPLVVAQNDIHSVSRWTLMLGLPAYFKLRWFAGIGRERYVPATFDAR